MSRAPKDSGPQAHATQFCLTFSNGADPFSNCEMLAPIKPPPRHSKADVIFRCTLQRRANAFNAPWILGKSPKFSRGLEQLSESDSTFVPTSQNLVEDYVLIMAPLESIHDLKLQLQHACGIPASSLMIVKRDEVTVIDDVDDSSPVKSRVIVSPLLDEDGPCIRFKNDGILSIASDVENPSPSEMGTHILAFEVTLNARPDPPAIGNHAVSRKVDATLSWEDLLALEYQLKFYGDDLECRVFDTDPFLISKAVSRALWPRREDELRLGLRVDAADHRGHWFSGSVVEIVEGVDNGVDENATLTKVRIHFDNFSSKWDEVYTIDHFNEGLLQPLYAHVSPRLKPTEFTIHHRFTDRASKSPMLFGQPLYLQCETEWSTVRAGAHILGQASIFLHRESKSTDAVGVDEETERLCQRLYEKTQRSISDLIDLLIDGDREYVRSALGLSRGQSETPEDVQPFRKFDAAPMSIALVQKLKALLHRLPFEVRVCTVNSLLGEKSSAGNDEVPFPFSLMRTIGNYLNARHAIVLHWREPPKHKPTNSNYSNYLNAPVMYVKPPVIAQDSQFS